MKSNLDVENKVTADGPREEGLRSILKRTTRIVGSITFSSNKEAKRDRRRISPRLHSPSWMSPSTGKIDAGARAGYR